MDAWKRANAKFCTSWDLNARRYVKVDRTMKKKSRKIARKKLKNLLTNG